MKLSIVIPCYNESRNIQLIFDRFNTLGVDANRLEVIFVNNGSTDDSFVIFNELIPQHPYAKLVNVEKNKGYGHGIVSGLKQATGDFLGWMHADLQTDPNDVLKAYSYLEKNNWSKDIYFKGLRVGRSLFDSFFTWGMSLFETILLRTLLIDVNAQPNIFSRDFFNSWDNVPDDFALELYSFYKAKKEGLKIIRLKVEFPERRHGNSSWNTNYRNKMKFIKRTLSFSLALKKRL